MTKKAIRESGFDATTRYNWGFHDGTNDRTQQRRQLDGAKLALNGEGYIGHAAHFDQHWAAGYRAGFWNQPQTPPA